MTLPLTVTERRAQTDEPATALLVVLKTKLLLSWVIGAVAVMGSVYEVL